MAQGAEPEPASLLRRVAEAADGQRGLDEALRPGVDLVLLDLMLPRLNGLQVLTELRKTRPVLPVIILTARGEEDIESDLPLIASVEVTTEDVVSFRPILAAELGDEESQGIIDAKQILDLFVVDLERL